jgi:hypothetical protein
MKTLTAEKAKSRPLSIPDNVRYSEVCSLARCVKSDQGENEIGHSRLF